MNEYFVKYTYFIFGRWRGIFFGIRDRKRTLFGSSKIGDWRWIGSTEFDQEFGQRIKWRRGQ